MTEDRIKKEKNRGIKNLTIEMDIDCHRRVLEKKGIINKFRSKNILPDLVWDNFDIFQVSEKIARSLKAGGFTHIREFKIDQEAIFVTTSRSKGKKIKEAIKLFAGESELRKRYKNFRFNAALYRNGSEIHSIVDINRQHPDSTPAVVIQIKGKLEIECVKTILTELDENIKVKSLRTVPEIKRD